MRFEEEQPLPKAWALIAAIPAVVLLGVAVSADAAEEPEPVVPLMFGGGLTLLLAGWLLKVALETRVDDEAITLRYHGLFKTRRIPIKTIRRAEARRYRPLREYGGWGIKFGPSGWAYNVSGSEGVQLRLDGGKPLQIGSKRVTELANAITSSAQYRSESTLP
jgi:hypothetical protein